MRLRKKFAAALAGLSLATAMPAAAVETAAPAAAAADQALPDLSAFKLSDYVTDTRGPDYRCGDSNDSSCWTDAEREALAVWDLKNMLMLAHMGCRLTPGYEDLSQSYDAFYANNRTLLSQSYAAVAGRFASQFPPAEDRAAKRAQDALDTTTVNMFSSASLKDGYCKNAGQILRHLAAHPEADTRQLARQLTLPLVTVLPKTPAAASR